MEELCKKFPRICNCPYKEDIDRDFQNGKTAYYVCQWLKKTEYTISYSSLKKYYDYLVENGEIKLEQKQGSPSHTEDELLTLLEKKTVKALKNLELDSANPNVQVQFILGALKLLVGTKQQLDINADVTGEVTTNLLEKMKLKRGELDDISRN